MDGGVLGNKGIQRIAEERLSDYAHNGLLVHCCSTDYRALHHQITNEEEVELWQERYYTPRASQRSEA
jgi:hypothetical protein